MPLLKQFKTDFGTIRITRSKTDGSMAYYQNGCFHSQSNKYGTSVCAYIHAIVEITRQARAKNILIVGCAGGTLATMLHRLKCKVTAVDINPMAFTIARTYFHLPSKVACICEDGIAYIQTTDNIYDAVVIDVFGSHNQVPPPFTTEDFFHDVADILSPSGVMIMNVITADDDDYRADVIALNAWTAMDNVTLVDWPEEIDRNTLIVAGREGRWQIPSGKEPKWMQPDMEGAICRKPRISR